MARDFAMIMPSFWTGESGKRLRGKPWAQILALYLMSCDQTCMTGLFKIAPSTICKETGIPLGEFDDAVMHLTNTGIIVYDYDAEVVWIENLTRFQVGDTLKSGDTKRMSIVKRLRWASKHPFIGMFFAKYGHGFGIKVEYLDLSNEDLKKTLLDTPCHTAHVTDLSLSSSSLKKEESAKTKPKKSKHTLPDGWSPNESTKKWARVEKLVSDGDVSKQLERFTNHAMANGKEFADWDRAFQTWLSNSIEYGHVKPMEPEQPKVYFKPYPKPVNPPNPEKAAKMAEILNNMGKSIT